MPTTVTKTIKPSGGDYTSASAWEAGQQGNLVTGDTVQVGFTMSDTQMTDPNFTNQFEEIEIHGFILDVSPSQMLC